MYKKPVHVQHAPGHVGARASAEARPARAGLISLVARRGAALTAGALVASAASGQIAWNAADEFSPTLNPAGAWSYGFTPGRFGAFTALNTPINVNGARFWSVSSAVPWIGKNPTANPILIADNPVLPPGVMMMHPGTSAGTEREAVLRCDGPRRWAGRSGSSPRSAAC